MLTGACKPTGEIRGEWQQIWQDEFTGSWVGRIDDEDLPVEMAVDWVRLYKAR